jgi:hypothetical protein
MALLLGPPLIRLIMGAEKAETVTSLVLLIPEARPLLAAALAAVAAVKVQQT